MHTSDTVQEKLSLYARFGVSIYFGAPGKKEFQHIVVSLAEKNGITMDEETLLAEANKRTCPRRTLRKNSTAVY